MGFLFGLLDNPYVPWVVGLAAVFFGYRFLANRVRIRVPGVPTSSEDLLSMVLGPGYGRKKLEREIARLKQQDNYLAAGKLLEEAGRHGEAAEAYIQGQEHWAAASTLEKLGRSERAAELYLQAGRPQEGGGPLHRGRQAGARGLALPGEGQQPRGGAAVRRRAPVGDRGRALREERLPAPGGRGVGEGRQAAEGGGGLREALHGERVLLHDVLRDRAHVREQERARRPAGSSSRRACSSGRSSRTTKGGYHRQAAEALLRLGQPGEGRRAVPAGRGPREGRGRLRAGGRHRAGRRRSGASWPSSRIARPRPRPGS